MIRRAYDRLVQLMAYCAAMLLGAMSLWISWEVVARYFFLSPTVWVADLSEYTLLWATFLAAPWVLRRDAHVRVELLVERIPVAWQRGLGVVVSLVAAAAFAIVAWRSGVTTWDYYERGQIIARIWQVPRWLPYLAIPLGSIVLAIEFLLRARHYATSADPESGLRARRTEGGL